MTLLMPLGFLAALLTVLGLGLPWWTAALPLGTGVLLLLLARRPLHVAAGLALLGLALGVLRADGSPTRQGELASLIGVGAQEVVALRGVVADEPSPRDRAQLVRLDVEAARLADGDWRPVRGVAQVTARLIPPLHYGDVLEVRARAQLPETAAPAGYAAYLRRQGIEAVMAFPTIGKLGEEPGNAALYRLIQLRSVLAEAIERHLPEPHAALVEGILLGRRATISKELTEQLRVTGLSHVTAVSGFNVSLVVAFAAGLFGATSPAALGHGWRRVLGAFAASAALWGFVALVGPSGSVLRAAAMAQLALVGRAFGRGGAAGGMLLWGSAFLAAHSPALLADVGWQLSFLGAAGLIWLGPVLERRLAWLPGLVRGPLAGTLAAQLFVFPVLASIFGNLSLVSPLANVLVIPLVPWIMLGGALLSGAGALLQPAAPLLASLTWVPVSVLLWVVEWCASLPWAATDLPAIGAGGVALYLALLVAFCGWIEWRAQRAHATPGTLASMDSSDSPTSASAGTGAELGGASLAGRPVSIRQRAGQVALAVLAALACVGLVAARPPGAVSDGFALSLATALPGLIVDAPDVAGGTVLLVQLPDGARVLVNGGPAAGSATTLLGQYLRPWDRTVDVVIAADAREVYLTGLTRVLERYRVGVLVDATGVARSGAARLLRETAMRRGVRRLPAETGTELQLASGLSLQMLSTPIEATSASGVTSTPTSQNVTPLALRVHWGTFGMLVPGDGSAAHVRSLLSGEHDLRSTVLLLTERTARSADGARLIRAADPELVVVQGDQRAPSVTAGAADGAGEHTSSGWADEDLPTRWHRTATDGPLRLRVSGDGTYVAVGG